MVSQTNDKILSLSKENFEGKTVVLGEGILNADIMLIGEAPGGQEEKQGKPFVGSAGKNLNEFLEHIDLKRENIYISNVVKIRPCKTNEKTNRTVNRAPNKKELEFFIPFLKDEIKDINPKIIVTLGNTALRAVLNDSLASIGDYHGKLTYSNDLHVFALYHPASIIYDQNLKKVYYEDLDKLKKVIHK